MIYFDADKIRNILARPEAKMDGYPHTKIIFRMLRALYLRQTHDEQVSEKTWHRNGRGFNGFDATPLTDIFKKYRYKMDLPLSDSKYVAKKLQRYVKQLVEIANERQVQQAPMPKKGKKEEKQLEFWDDKCKICKKQCNVCSC